MMISKDKQYRTRDGREVRIYATDGTEPHPIHGAVLDEEEGGWEPYSWTDDGYFYDDKEAVPHDIIEAKQRIKRTVWLNVFRNGEVVSTSEPPDHYITTIFACVPVEIDCEEGEGL
jgi:hypothetical protein